MAFKTRHILAVAAGAVALAALPALADTVGVTDKEIKIGNINPYSGPASAYGTIGKTIGAYFNKINEEGGINGRKITYITYDDAYSPPKAVEQARKLVESDQVAIVFQPLGTPSNSAIHKYMNAKKVPQLFVATGATKWNDPKDFPWTMGWQPNYQTEGKIYAKYILANHANGKIGVLFQNDDYGKDLLKGLKDGLGDKAASMIISEVPYEVSVPTIDPQIVQLKGSGADILVTIATPKFAAQTVRKVAELGWKPTHFLNNVGILSTGYLKDQTDPSLKDDPAIKEWEAFMDKYYPDGNKLDGSTVFGYGAAKTMVQVLKQAGSDLSRENIMKEAANLKDFELGVLVDGIKINTSATDFAPIEQLQMQKFNGEKWERFGPVMSGDASS